MTVLRVLAGTRAYQHIRERGLAAEDISRVFAASGAAKWLSICGLDQAVFGDFISAGSREICLYGTSVGAFKLAAACQAEPAEALGRLATAYIDQQYPGKLTADSIVRETQKILDAVLTDEAVTQILQHPRYRFHCGAVHCRGLLASPNTQLQKLGMVQGYLLAWLGRQQQRQLFSRTVFGDGRSVSQFQGRDGHQTHTIACTRENLPQAVLASGSIPVMMPGVSGVMGCQPADVFRDGGLLDYHPVPENVLASDDGLVLYPHFYPYLVEGWFDKFFPWRKVAANSLDNVVIIAPSAGFVRSLPNGRIPDRQDFYRFKGRDDQRQADWRKVVSRSQELGEEWLSLTKSGRIAEVVELVSQGS